MSFLVTIIFSFFIVLANCQSSSNEHQQQWDTIQVKASAYNSLPSQTTVLNPAITAWGDTLKPGMKIIAISRDLIGLGLKHNSQVKIEGLEGVYIVKDKMNKRWTRKIDIYMGTDIVSARNWGVKSVTLYYKSIVD